MTAASAGLSVVIPVHGRVALVQRAIDSLLAAGKNAGNSVLWEVLLIDDSPEEAANRLREMCACDERLRYLRGPTNVGAKRNYGARHARFDFFMFLDSDCSVSENYILAFWKVSDWSNEPASRPIGAIAGPIEMADDANSWLTKLADYSPLFNAPFEWPALYSEVYWACTANLGVSRAIFDSIGGFDETPFTVVGGEDVDFCLRLRDAGYSICCQQTAVVIHTRTLLTSYCAMLDKMMLYGRSSVYNTTRHPRHGERHANPALLVVLGVLLAPSRRGRQVTAAVLVIWFVAQTAQHIATRGFSRLAPLATGLDWVFDLGIALEAVKRKKPWLAWRRFRYFYAGHFVPLPANRKDQVSTQT